MVVKLPLPSNFFQCPILTQHESEVLKQHAIQTATDVIHKTQLNGTIRWNLRADEVDLKIYRGDDPSAKPGSYLYMSVMEVAGTLDEVVELFQTCTTEKAKSYTKRFGNQLIDAVHLYNLVKPTPAAPRELIGVTWRAYKSPLSMFVAKRDACLLECNRPFTMNGRRGWVACNKSINLSCCPELQHLCGLIRMMNYGSGHVFLESDRPGYLEVRYVAQLDFRGVSYDFVSDSVLKRRAWVSDINMTKRCRNLTDIDRFLREDRLGRGGVLANHQLVPRSRRAYCYLCNCKFGWKRPKTNCHKCGQVACTVCCREWTIQIDSKTKLVKACARCALGSQGKAVAWDSTCSSSDKSSPSRRMAGLTGLDTTKSAASSYASWDFDIVLTDLSDDMMNSQVVLINSPFD